MNPISEIAEEKSMYERMMEKMQKEQEKNVILRAALALEAKLLVLHDSYDTYHKNYSPEALKLYAGFGNFSDAVHRIIKSGQLDRLPSDILHQLAEYSLMVSDELNLGVRMESKGDRNNQTDYQTMLIDKLSKLSKIDNGYVRNNIQIEIRRAWNDNGNNGEFFQSKLCITYKGTILKEINVQSTPDYESAISSGEDWIRLPAGKYEGRLLNKSSSYLKPIHIVNKALGAMEAGKKNGDCLIHPNVKTAKGQTEPYGNGINPYSLACQISNLENFKNMTNILESLGFKYGDENDLPWTSGDSIPIVIYDFPDSWAGPYTLGK